MPSIQTLIADIYALLGSKEPWFTGELADTYADNVKRRLEAYHTEEKQHRLRLSQMGPRCEKALWLSIHAPELAEPLPGKALLKYTYGHHLEEYILMLAKAAGHTVEGMQDELVVNGIRGHRDAVIDGCLVDVKSVNSRSFDKISSGGLKQDDAFGYLDQLDGYALGSADDPLVRVKDKAYILAIDQEMGGMHLYEHTVRETIRERIDSYKAIVAKNFPPDCTCETVPDGASGNRKLDVRASYSPFKWECFPHLRCFYYSNGRRYLTTVAREPLASVPEVDRHGVFITRAS